MAGIGPLSIITGSEPASVAVCTRAIGLSPSDFAFSADMNSSAAEPSEICEELPAWITPSSENAGLSWPIFSSVVPRRMPSSLRTTLPSWSLIPTI